MLFRSPPRPLVKLDTKTLDEDLLQLYTVSDLHVGQLSWEPETGAAWDLDICERLAVAAVENLAARSNAKYALLNLQGDFFDWYYQPTTPSSGHPLDVDGRSYKVYRAGIRIVRKMVDVLLSKHSVIHISIVTGNHDTHINDAFSHAIELLYERDGRVLVNASPKPHKTFKFGKTLLAFSHGHLKKFATLDTMFAAMYPAEFGTSTYRYVHCGHYHHIKQQEGGLFTVTQHPALVAPSAYAANGGWISKRRMLSHTYHSEYGEMAVLSVTPEMIGND